VQVSTERRTWVLPLAPMPPTGAGASYATLRSDTSLGKFVTCVGDFSGGASLQCIVSINRVGYYKPKGGTTASLFRTPVITIRETL
jgi:hypothetical protein